MGVCLCVCMCVFVWMCVCLCVCMCVFVWMCVCLCVCVRMDGCVACVCVCSFMVAFVSFCPFYPLPPSLPPSFLSISLSLPSLSLLPLRPSKCWDIAPRGFEHISPLQYKAMQGTTISASTLPPIILLLQKQLDRFQPLGSLPLPLVRLRLPCPSPLLPSLLPVR